MEPLALAALAGLTPDEHEVVVIDDRIETIPYHRPTDLVALNVETYTARRAYQIAEEYRAQGVTVVMGGFHPTLVPEEAAQHADAVVVGEAETIWPTLLQDYQRGELNRVYHATSGFPLSEIRIDRSVYSGKRYLPIHLVETGRGCFQCCDFCSVTRFFDHQHRRRPVEAVISEIESLDPNKLFFFVDDNIAASPQEARAFFKRLVPLNIRWVSQMTINAARDETLLDILVDSGCLGLLIGFESLNAKTLDQMNKAGNLQNGGYELPLRLLRERAIKLYATFLLGYDGDDSDTVKATLDFALHHNFFLAAFNHLVPFPSTPIYNRLESQGRLRSSRWWLDATHHFGEVVFDPVQMTYRQLEEACMWLRREFYSWRNITRRMDVGHNIDGFRTAAMYFQLNRMLQQEVDVKKGLPLGVGV